MVYSTSDHKRKHFHTFLQNKNKEMETRLPMSALQKIFATCWFCIKLNFISLVNPPCEKAYSEEARGLFLLEAAPRMFEWVLNTPLILLKLLSLSTICEETYSELSQTFEMDVSARVVGLSL